MDSLSTSAKAFKEVQPKLPALWKLVIGCLENKGPCTAMEISKAVGRTNVWQRLSELERKGKVHQSGVRVCSVTGAEATVWDLGGVEKEELLKPPTSAQAKAILRELSEMLDYANKAGYQKSPKSLMDLVKWLQAR